VSVTAPLIEASPCARAMRGAAAKSTKNKLAVTFQLFLPAFSWGMNFFSLKFSASPLFLHRKKVGPKRKIPPPEWFWRWDSKIAGL
jgi:hypothetical protein